MIRKTLAGPALAALAAALVLGALEVGVRVRLPQSVRAALPHVGVDGETQRRIEWAERHQRAGGSEGWRIDVPDALLGWRPKPGVVTRNARPGSFDVTVTVNPQGLRGRAAAARQRTPGVMRIAVFGCSQTFGSGVEDDETFSARLAEGLRDVEVLNFGVHGYGTDQMLLRWESEGVAYAPDVVVLAFAYYHLDRNVSGFRFYAKPRFVLEADGALRPVGLPVPDPETLLQAGVPPPPWPLADRSVLLRWLWGRELTRRHAALHQSAGPAWDVTRALITRLADGARRAGARVILLNIDEDAPWLSEPLSRLAAELGITWADAERALGEPRSRGVRLRLFDDPHWNPQGHAVIAGVLREAVCRPPAPAACAAGSDT